MHELLEKFNGGQLIGLAAVVGGLLYAVIAVVMNQWRRVRVAESEAALKQQMLDRGMSADEIEKVMLASREPMESLAAVSTGNQSLDKAALAQRMVEHGYEGADIERVLNAYQSPDKQVAS